MEGGFSIVRRFIIFFTYYINTYRGITHILEGVYSSASVIRPLPPFTLNMV